MELGRSLKSKAKLKEMSEKRIQVVEGLKKMEERQRSGEGGGLEEKIRQIKERLKHFDRLLSLGEDDREAGGEEWSSPALHCCLVCSSSSSLFTPAGWTSHAASRRHVEAKKRLGRSGGVVMVGTREQLLATICSSCGEGFPSRWQLHRHILSVHLANHTPTVPGRKEASRSRSNRSEGRSPSRSSDRGSRSQGRRNRSSGSHGRREGRKSSKGKRSSRSSSSTRSRRRKRRKDSSRDRRHHRSRSQRTCSKSSELKKDKMKKVKEEEVDKNSGKSLEYYISSCKVHRKSGRTTARLTQGEALLIRGKGGKTLLRLNRNTKARVVIQGMKKCLMTIDGLKKEVLEAEDDLSKILSEGTYFKVPLELGEIICLIGKGGKNIKVMQEKTEALIYAPTRGSGGREVILSGRPEDVKIAKGLVCNFISSRTEIKMTIEQAMILRGPPAGGGRTMANLREKCKTDIEVKSTSVRIYGTEAEQAKALSLMNHLFRNAGVPPLDC